MIIDKLTNSSYKLTHSSNLDILAKIFDIFNIKYTLHVSSLILYNINSLENFREWRDNLPHPCIDYENTLSIFYKLGSIFLYLEKISFQLSSLDENNIIVVNNDIVIPTNIDNIFSIEKNQISIETPLNNNKYLSLELRNKKILPILTSYKCVYSSLALFIIDIFLGIDKNPSKNSLIEKIKVIYSTRLYWLIRNLLLDDINECLIINI